MFTILDTTADNALLATRFACDLGACNGGCCTMPGGRGAPLEENEVTAIEEVLPIALPYLPEQHREKIEAYGAVEGRPGDWATRCIDNRACVFVYYEGEVAKCAIERAYFNGETTFRKPLSCHLFPIRVSELFGGKHLQYEKMSLCNPAVERGRVENIPMYLFLKEPLIRAFGEDFYNELEALALTQQG